jgi:hypothetical protein
MVGGTVGSNGIEVRMSGVGGSITGVNSDTQGQCTASVVTGVRGNAHGGFAQNYGVYGSANTECSNCPNAAYGVYGTATLVNPACQQAWAGYFNGRGFLLNGPWTYSDENLKTNVNGLSSSLEKINALKMYSYNFNVDINNGLNLPTEVQYGPLAQELMEIFPEMVTPATQPPTIDENGNIINEGGTFLAVNTTQLIPHLVTAIQELKAQLDVCCASADTKSQEVTEQNGSKSTSEAYLFQNTPNPHQGYTVIRYYIPDETKSAEIQFFDMSGQIIKVIPLNQFGFSEVQLNAPDMSNGMYTYGLLVDDKMVDMKKMIKE